MADDLCKHRIRRSTCWYCRLGDDPQQIVKSKPRPRNNRPRPSARRPETAASLHPELQASALAAKLLGAEYSQALRELYCGRAVDRRVFSFLKQCGLTSGFRDLSPLGFRVLAGAVEIGVLKPVSVAQETAE